MDKYDVLKKYFGHTEFRNGQSELIDNILGGKDVLGIMPTGAGKSVCYQVPAMLMDGITIVISPLISLMKDQVSSLVDSGIPAAFINSSLTYSQYLEVFRRAKNNMYRIIYVAPERLTTDEFIAFAESAHISMVTVDEAHCISQWGQDFRPSYCKITEFISRLSYRPVISAFTATATAAVRDDIAAVLKLADPFIITTGFDRQNLYFEVRRPAKKLDELLSIMNENEGRCAVIYCLTRKNVDMVCDELNERGISAAKYHAGMSDSQRHSNQDDFLYDRKNVMVATNAFGMGIDKSNVSLVVHFNMPKDLESYYQEAGRAGRDGEPAQCILLYSGQDVRTNQFLIDNSDSIDESVSPELREELRKKDMKRLRDMTFYSTTDDCLRAYILKYFGEKPDSFCGHCSNCCKSFETVDISVDAQKIVSCVCRLQNMGRTVGKSTVADILRGAKTEKIISSRFNELPTYSIMSDIPMHRLRSIIDFLIRKNYLALSDGDYPVLTLTADSAKIVRDKITVLMKLPKEKTEKQTSAKTAKKDLAPVDEGLLLALKKLRTALALKAHLPAYIIFTDASLRDMCKKLPSTAEEFLNISGVGSRKCEQYGAEFMKVIKEYSSEKHAESPKWTDDELSRLKDEYKSGFSVNQICVKHNRAPDEIRSKLAEITA